MVIFSVDGLEDTNHLYRQGVNWNNVLRSMKAFISAGGIARWDFLVFAHNQHQVEEAELLSKQIGFNSFTAKKSARFLTAQQMPKDNHQAMSRKGKNTIEIKKPDQKYQNTAFQTQEIIIKKYGSMDNYHNAVPVKCKVEKEESLFISAEGLVLPCCWTAGRMYRAWMPDPKTEQIWLYIDAAGGKDAINAKKHGIAAVFETGIFDNIKNSWSKKSCADGKLKVCASTCGLEFDPFKEQFK
jgi:MoaA/NifB/PqqE/SkfB family radical SAM enzyme